ncbi:hypothetical protein B0H15DRAFT_837197 [Mycena belliarum]|uniref:Uncharacterized protein n=1 Tax=Mycena belliarum TaxID=1033014 RepID=A0AAD6U7K4_9AGAR|nr:hypothetical protein B0H15DRAFT_837197 [Mycena belliae]
MPAADTPHPRAASPALGIVFCHSTGELCASPAVPARCGAPMLYSAPLPASSHQSRPLRRARAQTLSTNPKAPARRARRPNRHYGCRRRAARRAVASVWDAGKGDSHCRGVPLVRRGPQRGARTVAVRWRRGARTRCGGGACRPAMEQCSMCKCFLLDATRYSNRYRSQTDRVKKRDNSKW